MISPKMQATRAAGELSINELLQQESSANSSEADERDSAQFTPDTSVNTSPRSVGTVFGHPEKPSVRLKSHGKLKENIIEDSNRFSRYSIDSEVSEEAPKTSHLGQEGGFSSALAVSLYNSVIDFFNLAKRNNSRAVDARVQSAVGLIKSFPKASQSRVRNPTRTLNPRQHEQLLEIIEGSDEFPENLRLEYTNSTHQLEIRMVTKLHEGIMGEFNVLFGAWKAELQKSSNRKIKLAANTLRLHGTADIELPVSEEADDTKSPDNQITHEECRLECSYPALVLEVAFSNGSRDTLESDARKYIVQSKGQIRTVIAVYMGDMYAAERKNEKRLKDMYRASQDDESVQRLYPTDDRNITGGASILVWRAEVEDDNSITMGRLQEQKFREENGDAIKSASICIPLVDCVCQDDINRVKRLKAPPLEISSEILCKAIQLDLIKYRKKRAEKIRRDINKEKEKEKKEEEKRQRRERRINKWSLGRIREGSIILC
ncbi:hypothetical protein F4679DRAFT_558979 [Xylaria curta]|nr:hypothetical protein F4679DRAFT_558979 [Xylaria curta]